MSSYAGKFLRINLSNGEIKTEVIPEQVMKEFLGGRGFGIKYLYDEVAAGVEPLGPNNKLLLLNGPLAGTNAQSCSRWVAYTKSPLTGTVMRASGGGDFGAWMKWAGLDFIIIEGKAEKPVYIYIEDGQGEIKYAGDLWGKNTMETQERLSKVHGSHSRTACIGIAGENLALYSAIVSGRRTASRGGVGTVMGSKNLKAITINAKRRIAVHDPIAFAQAVKEGIHVYKTDRGGTAVNYFAKYGTGSVIMHNLGGFFPVRNFRYGIIDGSEELTNEKFNEITQKHTSCYSCMLHCGKIRTVPNGPYAGITSEGPEFQTIWAVTGTIDSNNLGLTVAANSLCDDLGVDTISAGNTIGFAFELFERGIIDKRDTDGLELKWGNHAVVIPLIKKIAQREGFGELLAQGTKKMAENIGKGAIDYAMQVKGLEISGYEPRTLKAQGFGYATSNMGANHNYGYAFQEVFDIPIPRSVEPNDELGKADIVMYNQDLRGIVDSAIACAFPVDMCWITIEFLSKLLYAATGIPEHGSKELLMKVGEKICNLERAFNVREGFSRKDDYLPKRMLTELLQKGPAEGHIVAHMDDFLDEYYDVRGWMRHGIPTQDKLKELGLDKVINDIKEFMTIIP